VMGMAVLPLLWASVLGAAARGLDQFGWWSRAELGEKVGRSAAFSVLAMMWPPSVLYAVTVVLAVQVGVTWGLATRVLRAVGTPVVSWTELRAAARFGVSAWATTGAHQLHERVDLVLLAALRGDPVEVAAYAVAVAVVHRLRVVPLALASALFPQVSGMETKEGAAFAAQVCRVALAASMGMGLVVAVVAFWAFPWMFGPAYTASVAPAWLLLPGVAALTPYVVLSRWFQARDRQGVNVGVLAVSLGVNVALNLWWIPTHGAVGAAGASLVSYLLQGVAMMGFFVRAAEVPLASVVWLRGEDLALLRGRE
jgi:O-antigen/teichoic acid export membrane protein